VLPVLGLPCVLKRPDSSFSLGVTRADTPEVLRAEAERFLERSELVIAQEFLPTEFDWRVGVFEGEPLWICKYHMAHRHWQIVQHNGGQASRYGRVETLAVADAPRNVVRTAVRAARLVGNGLYGVDVKQVGRKCYVMEVNDNPNVDGGYEDKVLGKELYTRILGGLLRRIERRAQGALRL
jgi:glutathione synthase/RimK-type ligase-like ATP-grasp enzyme